MTFVVIGDAAAIRDFLFGAVQHDEHCRAWRWHRRTLHIFESDRDARVRLDAYRRIRRELVPA